MQPTNAYFFQYFGPSCSNLEKIVMGLIFGQGNKKKEVKVEDVAAAGPHTEPPVE